mgnify:CR=1 FL=1
MVGLAILATFSGAGIIFVAGKFSKEVIHSPVRLPWGSIIFISITGIWLGLIFFSTTAFWLTWFLRAAGLDSLFALAPEKLSTAAELIAAAAYIAICLMRRRQHRTTEQPDNILSVKIPQTETVESEASARTVKSLPNFSNSPMAETAENEPSARTLSAFNKKTVSTDNFVRRKPLLVDLAGAPPRYLLILAILAGIFAFWLLYESFRGSNGYLQAGASVFSDMGPHTALTSAFAKGANIPPDYPHFAADGIRYHFFFYHLAGLLHAGGLSLVLSLNLLTWLGIVSFLLLLGLLAWRLTGSRGAILLAPFLAIFRSSCAFFTFLSSIVFAPDNISRGQKFLNHTAFIGNTPREDWGLWSINVYANQRHLPAALALLLILLLLQSDNIRRRKDAEVLIGSSESGFYGKLRLWGRSWLDRSFWFANPAVRKQQIITVLILFFLPFWHGSIFLTALMLLFCYALISDNRFYLLSGAALGLLYANVQSRIFNDGTLLPHNIFYFGFISEDKSPAGILTYILELTGILLPLLIIVFMAYKGLRLWIAVSSLPFIFSFLFSLTPDVTVNHKMIMISIILWSIPLAKFLLDLPHFSKLRPGKTLLSMIAVLLIFVLTITGLYEVLVFHNLSAIRISVPAASELSDWIEENTAPDAIFFTAPYSYDNFFFSGRRSWYGPPYYAWSAGHDTKTREAKLYGLIEYPDLAYYNSFFKGEKIDAILVDDEARNHPDFPVNEELIAALYPLVASFENDGNSRIYMVNEALFSSEPIHR